MRDFDQYNATYTACPAPSEFIISNKTKITKNKTKLTFLSFKNVHTQENNKFGHQYQSDNIDFKFFLISKFKKNI